MPHTTSTRIEPNNNDILTNSIKNNINGLDQTHHTTTSILTNARNDKTSVIPDIFSNSNKINTYGLDGIYSTQDATYKPYTIFDSDNAKFPALSASTTGSLSSIITTSVASSEPDPGSDKGGDGGDENLTTRDGTIIKQEEWWKTLIQVSIPFFIAGIGTIGAGVILGRVEQWTVFKSVRELFILVPALLGLKGNLDMCLASRLSTQANLGNMSSKREMFQMVLGNVALVQVQATVAAVIVSLFAVSVGAALNRSFDFHNAMLLIASSMFTATSTCFVLDFVLVAVIIFSYKFHWNPDNMATPLAASIGDVVSLTMLSFIASLLYDIIYTHFWVTFVIFGIYYLLLLPIWVTCVIYNKYTRPVLKSGWVPVLSALFISGLGGLVLDQALDVFPGFVVFQPIINGIGGNLVSVQASKISTMLHQTSILGIIPPHAKVLVYPWRALIRGVPYAKTARILILMSIPGQVVFIYAADFIHKSASTIGPVFVFSYLFVSLIQVCSLLYIAHIIIHLMWKWRVDPDNSAIPYLTALGDLFGSSFLAIAFLFMSSVGHVYQELPTDEMTEIALGQTVDIL